METNFTKQLVEKVPHLLVLLSLVAYSWLKDNYSAQAGLMFLIGMLIVFFFLEYLRLERNIEMPFLSQFIRPKEHNRFYGAVYFLIATVICLAAFDFTIALAAVMMAAFGDIAAAFFGRKYGKTLLFRNKTLQGAMAMLAVNLAVGFIMLSNVYIIIAMAIAATAIETLVDELDDNLWVPIVAGFIGELLFLM